MQKSRDGTRDDKKSSKISEKGGWNNIIEVPYTSSKFLNVINSLFSLNFVPVAPFQIPSTSELIQSA